MGGELGNETCIDLLLSALLSPPVFILMEDDHFNTNLVSRSGCFGVFADISARSSRKKEVSVIHIRVFACVRVFSSNFCSQICSGSLDTTLRSCVRFMSSRAREYFIIRVLPACVICILPQVGILPSSPTATSQNKKDKLRTSLACIPSRATINIHIYHPGQWTMYIAIAIEYRAMDGSIVVGKGYR